MKKSRYSIEDKIENQDVNRLNKSKATRAVLVCVALVLGWLWLFEPFKITDLKDPRFDPMRFSFSDYDYLEWHSLAPKIFHPGDSREKIEKILIGNVGAEARIISKNYIGYYWIIRGSLKSSSQSVHCVYDEKGRVIAMSMGGATIFNQEELDAARERSIVEERKRVLRKSNIKP